jgi:hypothetical protein
MYAGIVAVIIAVMVVSWSRSRAQDQKIIHYGESQTGTIAVKTTEAWTFGGTAGEIIAITVERASGDLTPTVSLVDPAARPVVATQGNPVTLSQIRLAETGDYTILIGGVDPSAGDYKLTLTLLTPVPPTETPMPTLEPRTLAGTLSVGVMVHGELTATVYRQFWSFQASSGDVVDITMKATGGNLDPFLALVSPANDTIASNDSASGGPDAGILGFQLPFTGTYTIVARRAGKLNGQGGDSTGTYDLIVSSRGVGSVVKNTTLNSGEPVLGQLNDLAPRALYRQEIGGPTAFYVDLGSLHRTVGVRIMTTDNRVLGNYAGLNPLSVAYDLPQKGPFLVEVTAAGYDTNSITNFTIASFHLSASFTGAIPLHYGDIRHSTANHWIFIGSAGDVVRLGVQPNAPAISTTITLTGPNDIPLLLGAVGAGFSQTITLPTNGAYEIEFSNLLSYQVNLDRIGAGSMNFDRFPLAQETGPLSLAAPMDGKLAAGGIDSYFFDAVAGNVINLAALPTSNAGKLALVLAAPDGHVVIGVGSERLGGALIESQQLPQTGRYRVLVSDLSSAGGTYTLHYEDTGGGLLTEGQPVKGIVSPTNGFATWSLDNVPAGSLVNLHLTTLTPLSWNPGLQIVTPDGFTIASTQFPQNASSGDLLGVTAPSQGQYHIIVAGSVSSAFASYSLTASVEAPFGPTANSPITVAVTRAPQPRYSSPSDNTPLTYPVAPLILPPVPVSKIVGNGPAQIGLDTNVRGEIKPGELFQIWRFNLSGDTQLTVRATSLSGTQGPALMIADKQGKTVQDAINAADPTTTLTYRSSNGGTYEIVVQMGLDGGRYLLALEKSPIVTNGLKILPGMPITLGATVANELLPGDADQSYYFYGTLTDTIRANVLVTDGDLAPTLTLIDPAGKTVTVQDATPTALNSVLLSQKGVYTLTVGHANGKLATGGRYLLTLGNASGTKLRLRGGGTITAFGSRIGYLNPDNTTDTWLFTGKAGERVTFLATSPLVAPLSLSLADTAGRIFASQNVTVTQNTLRLSDLILPADGVYQAILSGGSQTAGTYTLAWVGDTIIAGGTTPHPVNYGQTVGGVFSQNNGLQTWTFAGTAGDTVSVALHYERGDSFTSGFQVRSDTGVVLTTVADPGDGSGAHADNLELPDTGNYQILVANAISDFKGAGVYSLTLRLQNTKARSIGGVLAFGQPAQGVIYPDDPADDWLIPAQGGAQVRVRVEATDKYLKPGLELRSSTGRSLGTADSDANGVAQLGEIPIPLDDTYVVVVRGEKSSGGYRLIVENTKPPETVLHTIKYGDQQKGLVADDRPREFWQFGGTGGDDVNIQVDRTSGSKLAAVVELIDFDSQRVLVRDQANDAGSALIPHYRLPYTGSFAVIVTRYGEAAGHTNGNYQITLQGSPDANPVRGKLNLGQKALGRLSDDSPVDRWTFDGKKNTVIGISAKATSGDLDTFLTLADSTGRVLTTNDDFDGTNAVIAGFLLPADDTYTVIVSRLGTKTVGTSGNYDLRADILYQFSTVSASTMLPYGSRIIGTVDTTAPEQRYTFSGLGSDIVNVTLIHQTDDAPPILSIQDPTGTTLATGTLNVGATTITGYRLPTSGLYTLLIKRPINTRLSYTPFELTLDLVSGAPLDGADATGGVIAAGDSVRGQFHPGDRAQYWLMTGKAETTLSASLVVFDGDFHPSLLLIAPDGTQIASASGIPSLATASFEGITLPADGIYTLLVVGQGSGQYRLSMTASQDALSVGKITPGTTVAGTLDPLHPTIAWTFDGLIGQVVSTRVVSADFTPTLRLVDKTGVVLGEGFAEHTANGESSAILNVTLPADGTFTIVVGKSGGVGLYKLGLEMGTLATETVVARPLAYGNQVRDAAQAGATDYWVFSGTAGDTISAAVTSGDKIPAVAIALHDAGGKTLTTASAGATSEADIPAYTLPKTGRYVIAVPMLGTTSYALTINRRQSLLNNTQPRILVADKPLENGVLPGSDVDYWTFNAKKNDVVQLTASRVSGDLRPDMALYGPNGFVAAAVAPADGQAAALANFTLPDDGTYRLVITHWLNTAGRYRLTLSFPKDSTPASPTLTPTPITLDLGAVMANASGLTAGASAQGELTTIAPLRAWVFGAKAGDRYSILIDPAGQFTLRLITPDGAIFAEGTTLNDLQIAREGLYAIVVSGGTQTTGKFTISLQRTPPGTAFAGKLAIGGTGDGLLTTANLLQSWTVDLPVPATLSAVITSPTVGFDALVTIATPDGSPLTTSMRMKEGTISIETAISTPGTYALVVSARTGGRYTLKLGYGLTQTGGGVITLPETTTGQITHTNFTDLWRISLHGGQLVNIHAQAIGFLPALAVFDTDGAPLLNTDTKTDSADLQVIAPIDGLYVITVSRVGGATGAGIGTYVLSVAGAPK